MIPTTFVEGTQLLSQHTAHPKSENINYRIKEELKPSAGMLKMFVLVAQEVGRARGVCPASGPQSAGN